MIRYSNGAIVDRLYTSDGTTGTTISQITTALFEAGWTLITGSVYESATTPGGFKIRVDVLDSGGIAVQLRIQSDDFINHGFGDGAYIEPVVGRVFRVWANKYQCYHFMSGAGQTSQPSSVAFGVLWTPPFIFPLTDTFVDTPIILFTETSTEDCAQRVYGTWTFGPWGTDTEVRIYGHVDDDIRVNGVIWDEGMFPFDSGRGVPCDGIANGQHDFDKTITVSATTPLVIELVNNFISTASLNCHVLVQGVATGPNPWYGWMCCNGPQPPGGGFNASNYYSLSRGIFQLHSGNAGGMWIWDGVPYHDAGGGDIQRLVCQVAHTAPDYTLNEASGYWANGVVSIYEPYMAWPSGHTTSGNWTQQVRKGQLWDSMVYAAPFSASEATIIIDGKKWRNITIPDILISGPKVPHSLLLLTN